MSPEQDVELWNNSAEAWIAHLTSRGDQSRRFLDPRVWQVLGDVTGKKVLDIGCGEGRFSRQLAKNGAIPTGIEPAPKLFRRAVELGGGATFINTNAEDLPFDDNSFDIAIFYLVLIDIEPMTPAIQEAFRVLKPGGRCVVVNCTSMNTATNRFWDRNEQGEKVAWLVEHYGTSQMVLAEWNGIKVHNYHRPLSAYLTQFLETGFRLASFDEPIPTESELDIDPGLAPHLICPLFNLQIWQK